MESKQESLPWSQSPSSSRSFPSCHWDAKQKAALRTVLRKCVAEKRQAAFSRGELFIKAISLSTKCICLLSFIYKHRRSSLLK